MGGVGSGSFGGAEVWWLFLCRVFLYLGEFSVVGGGVGLWLLFLFDRYLNTMVLLAFCWGFFWVLVIFCLSV